MGCIYVELMTLRPLFKGEEIKMEPGKKIPPFQSSQMQKIIDVLGTPSGKKECQGYLGSKEGGGEGASSSFDFFPYPEERWPGIKDLPDYKHLARLKV